MNEPYPNPAPPSPKRHSNVLPIVLTVILSLVVVTLLITDGILFFIRKNLQDMKGKPASFSLQTEPATDAPLFSVPEPADVINPPTAESAAQIEEQNSPENWQSYYADMINAYYLSSSSPNDVMYDLYDINGDDIPELFISEGEWHTAAVTVCTFYNGVGKKLGDMIGSYGTLLFHDNTGTLICIYSGQGYTYRTDYYLHGDELQIAYTFSDNTGAVTNESDYVFMINNEYVTSNVYYDILNQRNFEDCIELGRNFFPDR